MYSVGGHRAPGRSRHRKAESDPGHSYVTLPSPMQQLAPARQPGELGAGTTAGMLYRPPSPSQNRIPSVERVGGTSVLQAGSHLAQYQSKGPDTSRFQNGVALPTPVSLRSPSPVLRRSREPRSSSGQGSARPPHVHDYLIKSNVPQPPLSRPVTVLDAPSVVSVALPPMSQEREAPAQPQKPPSPTPSQGEPQGSHRAVYQPPSPSANRDRPGPSDVHHSRRHHSNSHRDRDRDDYHYRHYRPHYRSDHAYYRSRPRHPDAPSHRHASGSARPTHGQVTSTVWNASHVSLNDGVPLHRRHQRRTSSPPPGAAESYYQAPRRIRSRSPPPSPRRSHTRAYSRVPSPAPLRVPSPSPTVPPTSNPPHKLEKPPPSPPSPPPAVNEVLPNPLARGRPPVPAYKLNRTTHRPALPSNYNDDDETQTRYVNMLLAMDGIPPVYYALSWFFTWILLAGFVVLPATFASFKDKPAGTPQGDILKLVNNSKLYIVAFVCTGTGALGMLFLWWRWHANYVWITNRIFLPGFLNSIAGIISTVSSVYGAQKGVWGRTEKSAILVTGSLTLICGTLVLVYDFWLIRNLRLEHDREDGAQLAGKFGEGVPEEYVEEEGHRAPTAQP